MKRKKINGIIISVFLVLSMAFSVSGSVLAAGGDGSGGGGGDGSGGGSSTDQTTVVETPVETTTTDPGAGDGSGGGKEEPLALVSADPAVATEDILVGSTFTLEFNKNIAYVAVRDNNLKAFTLWEGDTLVPVDVTMADDQLEPDLRDFVLIVPKEDLKAGTAYTLKVDNTLVAKSGAVLTEPMELTYTTVTPNASIFTTTNIILMIGAGIVVVAVIAVVVMKRKKA
ncbi:Ig-like domain-containing protein [Acetobacterium bakii]|uniref:SbsA Ig-like domain-containing protein n=1 Tax=Acetobacterium bakii TaxID=52689 RepID=A0A0L6TVW1_9FIRM|nr:Ig-like domain-containing protein [Acetobacterium bakii]KNZ40396.1 hypothetical protein AKG39_17895 [Acetobacterium bakii]